MTIDPGDLPRNIRSAHVFVRFGMRILLLTLFTTFMGASFGRAMLWISMILCFAAALLRRERPLDGALTYWDECAAYGALYCAASAYALNT